MNPSGKLQLMRSRRFWLIGLAIWVFFGLMVGVQVWISMITHGHSVPRLLSYYIVIWGSWIFGTALVVWLAQRYPVLPPKRLHFAVHALAACAFAVVHIAFWLTAMLLMQPFDRMTAAAEQIRVAEILISRFPLELVFYAASLGCVQMLDYYEKFRAAQSSLNEARLHSLELQLQPHFLFNTLNSVSALVRVGKQEEAVKMIAMLSELLRYTLDRADTQRVPLEEEVTTLRRYLEIQQMRFADRLSLTIDVADDVLRVPVPTFILQPLAENAVRHGIAQSASEGRLEVRAFRENGFVNIEMFNTGSLSDEYVHGVGLANTTARLEQMYGGAHKFALTPARGGVVASVSIPWSEHS